MKDGPTPALIRRLSRGLAVVAARPTIGGSIPLAGAPIVLTPKALEVALATKPQGAEARELAGRIRAIFGREKLLKGPYPTIDELIVACAIEVPDAAAAPKIVSDDTEFTVALTRVGNTDVYAAVATFPHGFAMLRDYEVGGKKIGLQPPYNWLEVYQSHPDSREQPGVPKGKLIRQPQRESKLDPGTPRSTRSRSASSGRVARRDTRYRRKGYGSLSRERSWLRRRGCHSGTPASGGRVMLVEGATRSSRAANEKPVVLTPSCPCLASSSSLSETF